MDWDSGIFGSLQVFRQNQPEADRPSAEDGGQAGCWLLVSCCWVLVAGCPENLFEYYTDKLKPSTILHVMGVPFW